MKTQKLTVIAAAVCLLVGALGAEMARAEPQLQYTGCLYEGNGMLVRVAEGDEPLSQCLSSMAEISFPGTDETDDLQNQIDALTDLNTEILVDVNCDEGDVLQDAIDAAGPQTIIHVQGTCTENITIGPEKQDVTIRKVRVGDGSIVAATNKLPAIKILGRDITIANFQDGPPSAPTSLISGGRNGIRIESASARILDNNILLAENVGISVAEQSFAVIHSNLITQNGANGIGVSGGSTAEIGFCLADYNVIDANGQSGIAISQNSTAEVFGNAIRDNAEVGIFVTDNSMADTGSNIISGNTDGVDVRRGSSLRMGRASGTGCVETPNTDGGNANTGLGIDCRSLSTVDGRLGTLGTFATAELRDTNADCPNCCFTSLADQPAQSP